MLLELELLRTFQAVAGVGSFTIAAARLNKTQSAVSMQIKRLEMLTGKPLLRRNNQGVELTPAGETLLSYAARLLQVHDEAVAELTEPVVQGVVRLGAPADYAATFLADVLPFFAQTFPQVEIEVRCDLSVNLMDALAAGQLDVALATRHARMPVGERLRREALVWVAARNGRVHEQDPLPLALFPKGCSYRELALNALAEHGRNTRIAYTSPSVTGLQVAVTSGFAVAVLIQSAVLPGMQILGPEQGLPVLPQVEIALYRADDASPPAACLADYIVRNVRVVTTGSRAVGV